MSPRRSAEILRDMLIFNVDALKADPERVIRELTPKAVEEVPRALESDRTIYRMIVATLCAILISVTLGVIVMTWLAGYKIEIPPEMNSLASGALGALVAVLVPKN